MRFPLPRFTWITFGYSFWGNSITWLHLNPNFRVLLLVAVFFFFTLCSIFLHSTFTLRHVLRVRNLRGKLLSRAILFCCIAGLFVDQRNVKKNMAELEEILEKLLVPDNTVIRQVIHISLLTLANWCIICLCNTGVVYLHYLRQLLNFVKHSRTLLSYQPSLLS